MITVILHLANEDPVLGDIDDFPGSADTIITIKNPRRRDGKDVHYLEADVTTVIWPINRISFIEIMPSGEEEEIIGFVRE